MMKYRTVKLCDNCGKRFYTFRGKQRYCSEKCGKERAKKMWSL